MVYNSKYGLRVLQTGKQYLDRLYISVYIYACLDDTCLLDT